MIICQGCKKEIPTSGKIGFREECPFCNHDLHSCIHCNFYDVSVYNECREPSAERVLEKQKANYCEYFVEKSAASTSKNPADDAKKNLEALFKKS